MKAGARADRRVVCELTDMDQPLGQTVGTRSRFAKRSRRCAARACGPPTELSVASAAHLVTLCDGGDLSDARARVRRLSTAPRSTCSTMGPGAGGTPEEDALPQAPVVRELKASRDGRSCGSAPSPSV